MTRTGGIGKRKAKAPSMKEADRLFSLFIRQRDGVCQKCGDNWFLQNAHIISRSYRRVRFDPDNCMALCRKCHMYFTPRPIEWEDWCRKRGIDWDGLRYKALHGPLPDYKEVIAWLRTEVA